jgi:hypothetical protein
MNRKILLLAVSNATIVGTLFYLRYTGELARKNLPLVAAISFVLLNALLLVRLRGSKT